MATVLTPKALSKAVDKRFRGAGVAEALRDVHFEKLGRRTTSTHPLVVTWNPAADDRDYFPFKPAPGSVNVYWGAPGSRLIRDLEAAHLSRDPKALQLLASQVAATWRRRRVLSIPDAAKEARNAPMIFDVRYAGKTLAESLWPPSDGCGTLTLPYTGGSLQLEEFAVVNYLTKDARDTAPAVLIVVAPPVLSELERRALETVPAIQSEMNIGGSPIACTALVAVVVFVAAVTVVTTCCQPFHDKLDEVELSDKTLKDLGAMPSVSRLLAIRARIFEEFDVR